jgi:integrase/recombinase XerD
MLFVDTGLRAGELCSLRLDDLHIERREIVIRASIAKSKRPRLLPLGASLSALRRYLKLRGESTEQSPWLFLSFYSTPVWAGGPHRERRQGVKSLSLSASPLTRTGIYQLVRTWGRLASIKEARCSPHTFRHYFATGYLRRGGDIVTLQRILGHARLAVTERYLAITDTDVKGSHERFSPAASLVLARSERLRD